MTTAAILPSRNEPITIAAVTRAVDTALVEEQSTVVHADSSDTPATAWHFAATTTRAAKVPLTGLTRGKGAQILAAAHHPEVTRADAVLIADTDTQSPDPAVYTALLDHVRAGASMAIADYPRYWHEANLTNHLARPLIAATTGHDVPQPLAGDLALSPQALTASLHAIETLPAQISACVDGYGIDAFLLLTAATAGPTTSVRFEKPKQHASSFSHLPAIYHQAVPVLLHLTANWSPQPTPTSQTPAPYRTGNSLIDPARLKSMLTTLHHLGAHPSGYGERPWPLPVADAWRAVNCGMPEPDATRRMWPHYLRQVTNWLTSGARATAEQRAEWLATAHSQLYTAVLTSQGTCR